MNDRYLEGRYRQQLINIRNVTEFTLHDLPDEERKDNHAMDYEDAIILIHNMLIDTERSIKQVEELEEYGK